MTCTAAAIIAFLGYMPPKGTVIIIPRAEIEKYTILEQTKARICARRHGIKWKVEDVP